MVDRIRATAYLCVALAVIGMFGLFLFLTYYFQGIAGYSPLQTGLAFLPMSAAVLIGSNLAARLLPRVSMRTLIAPGFVLAGLAMLLLTQLSTHTSFIVGILPAEVLLGLGMGLIFTPAMSAATLGVDHTVAGIASAAAIAATQTGAAIGTATLNSIAASGTTAYLATHSSEANALATALVHGFAQASFVAAVILAVGAVMAAAFVATRHPAPAVQV